MIHVLDLNFLDNKDTIASFLIETSERPILVETGPYSTYKFLQKALKEKGYKVSDIKHVLITHIHLDHAGAAWALAKEGANIYLHPFGADHLEDPSKLMASAKRIYKDDMKRLWGTMEAIPKEQLITVQDKQVLNFGDVEIKAWHTQGHANHHIAWQYDKVLFTGDVAGVKIGNNPAIPPCPPPDISIQKWQKSIETIKKIKPEKLYLTHFGSFSGDINKHLEELENRLLNYADWVKTSWQKGNSTEKMIVDFQEYTNNELKNAGLDSITIKKYNAANPAWMCIAGLVRYWKKEIEKGKVI